MAGVTQPLKVLISIGGAFMVAGVAGYVYYSYFRKNKEIYDLLKEEPIENGKLAKVKVKIPRNSVGLIVGRHGINIKNIQEKTSTSITFIHKNENEELCVIKGNVEKVEKARELILKAICDIPTIESSEIFVPNEAIERITGQSGESLRCIRRLSGAKISLSSTHYKTNTFLDGDLLFEMSRKFVIKGTNDQIEAAKSKIMEKVEEEKKMQEQIKNSAYHISKRSKARVESNGNISLEEEKLQIISASFPATGSSKTYSEVFVSAVASATHFWVQVVGSKTVELDKLVSEMTAYYDNADNRALHIPDHIKQDDVVAARFPLDGMWYRGRVCPPTSEDSPGKHCIFFVDFGDTDEVYPEEICELRTDFLSLGFQAVECYLANVDPMSANSTDAMQTFESLTHATQWKAVMVRVLGYKQEGTDVIPCVRVINTSGNQDLDVAEELVKRRLANWSEEKFASLSSSRASLTEGASI